MSPLTLRTTKANPPIHIRGQMSGPGAPSKTNRTESTDQPGPTNRVRGHTKEHRTMPPNKPVSRPKTGTEPGSQVPSPMILNTIPTSKQKPGSGNCHAHDRTSGLGQAATANTSSRLRSVPSRAPGRWYPPPTRPSGATTSPNRRRRWPRRHG